jgi:hypothetical protein
MGWTSYVGMTAEEAVRYELSGMDILARSGSWWLTKIVRPGSKYDGWVTLIHAMSQRDGQGVAVKLVDASMGFIGSPPESIFRRWLKESEGQERGEYEREFIERMSIESEKLSATKDLKPGQSFRLESEVEFSDGVKEQEFQYCGKFRARRASDNSLVRLPRNFRKRIDPMTIS